MRDSPRVLVEQASRGDGGAVDELLARYLPALRAFVRLRSGGLVRDKESVSDLVQSTCRDILGHLDRFRYTGESEFKHWLFKTAARKIADKHRFYTRDRRDAAREVTGNAGDSPGRDESELMACYRSLATPSRAAAAREEMDGMERAFDQLPQADRDLILQVRLVGLSHADLAAKLGKTEVAVRKQLSRALARLSQLMKAKAG